MKRFDIGLHIVKFFLESEYKCVTYTQILLALRETYGGKFPYTTVARHLDKLTEIGILIKEARGYSLSFKILRNCHEQYEKKRKLFF